MANIEMVKVRARITIGNLSVSTPFIQSFSVNKTRGQISTFDVSMKILYSDVNSGLVGEAIYIEAGERSPSNTIFSGIVKKARISPVFEDPAFVLVSISGEDVLSRVSDKKYTRRCRGTNSSWVSINSVSRKGHKTGKFRARPQQLLTTVNTDYVEETLNINTVALKDEFKDVAIETPKGEKRQEIKAEARILNDGETPGGA